MDGDGDGDMVVEEHGHLDMEVAFLSANGRSGNLVHFTIPISIPLDPQPKLNLILLPCNSFVAFLRMMCGFCLLLKLTGMQYPTDPQLPTVDYGRMLLSKK